MDLLVIAVILTILLGQGALTTEVTVFLEELANIYCIHEDLFIPGNILICSGNALLTASRTTSEILEVVGLEQIEGYSEDKGTLARFDVVTDATQPNSSTTFVVDYSNHCLRSINRNNGQTTLLAGQCETPGLNDGAFEYAEFTYPYRMVLVERVIYLTEYVNQGLRSLNLDTRQVLRLTNDNTLVKPSSIIFLESTNSLLLTINHGIIEFNLDTRHAVMKAGSTYLTADVDSGPGLRAAFNNPRGLLLLGNNLLIADRENGKVKQLNMTDGTITTITSNIEAVTTISKVHTKVMLGQSLNPSKIFILDDIIPNTTTSIWSTPITTTTSGSIDSSSTEPEIQGNAGSQMNLSLPFSLTDPQHRQGSDSALAAGLGAGLAIAIVIAGTVIILVGLKIKFNTSISNSGSYRDYRY